jgi:hypothetical protein
MDFMPFDIMKDHITLHGITRNYMVLQDNTFNYLILSSIMHIQVLNFIMIFSRISSQELIIVASLFIIKAILNPFLTTFQV